MSTTKVAIQPISVEEKTIVAPSGRAEGSALCHCWRPDRADGGGVVARIGFSRNLGARADQAGLLVAAINAPTTFQRTLMPRPLADQAIVTGLSVASNHALVALMQEV